MILNIQVRPVGIALSIFVILYIGLNIFTHVIGWDGNPDSDTFLMGVVVGWFPWLIPGYIAANLAKTRGVLHGVVVGILTTIVIGVDYFVRFPGLANRAINDNWHYYLIYGALLSGLGSLAWDIKNMIKKRRSKSSTTAE